LRDADREPPSQSRGVAVARATAPVALRATAPPRTLATQQKDSIEAALTESKGRVSGPFGAASLLGIPSSTLESKIKMLKIDKRRFKPQVLDWTANVVFG